MFNSNACFVERTQDHHYKIRWDGPAPGEKIAIYMSDTPALFYLEHDHPESKLSAPIQSTTDRQVIIDNPDVGIRHYFFLVSESGHSITLAERRLALQGTPNFRDLGGYETSEGRRIQWGKIYRSGKLSTLTEADIKYLSRLGVSLVCDFRQETEQALEPTRLGDENTPIYTGLPISPGSAQSFMHNLMNGIIEIVDSVSFMQEINRDFVANQMPQYAEMFKFLLTGEHQILIHCAAGKDRTGFGAALILDVLGVDEEVIIDDYLLTNEFLEVEKEMEKLSNSFTNSTGSAVPDSVLRPLLEVRPEYLRACFEEINERYGSKQAFFKQALGLDDEKIQRLKKIYLEP